MSAFSWQDRLHIGFSEDAKIAGGTKKNAGFFAGDLDEVRVWRRVLTAEEIHTHWVTMGNAFLGDARGLIVLWTFDAAAPGELYANDAPGGARGAHEPDTADGANAKSGFKPVESSQIRRHLINEEASRRRGVS